MRACTTLCAVVAALSILTACGDDQVADPSPNSQTIGGVLSLSLLGGATSDTLTVGDTIQLTATLANRKKRPRPTVWTSSDTAVASVSRSGLVTALGPGATMIKASNGIASDSVRILVRAAVAAVASVTITPATASVAVGDTVRLTATLRDAGGNVLSGGAVAWRVSDTTVATVSNTGLVTARKSGSAAVTATSDGKSQSAQVTVQAPATGTAIYPGSDIQAAVNANPSGTTFVLKAGLHRRQHVTPKSGNTFIGEPGTILSGAVLLTSFVREGAYWVASGVPIDDGWVIGDCESEFPMCNHPQEFFLDDAPLRRVATAAEVTSGRWYLDVAAKKAYLADDPTNKKAELSVTAFAFEGSASNVTIRGLVIEKYTSPAQHGAIHGDNSTGWIVRDNEVRLNHGVGIRIGPGMQVINNRVHHQGQLGIGGIGNDVLVENNEIAYNNRAHFSSGWEAGGTKFVNTDRLVVRGNYSHHNDGPGLWTDGDNINTLYDGNRVEDNVTMGIFHEIGYAAVIRNNTVSRNGFGWAEWLYGGGILISSSRDVEIYGNTVTDNARGITAVMQNRGTGRYGAHVVENLFVHDNIITMRVVATDGSGHGNVTGLAQDVGDLSFFTSRNNRFQNNTYYLGTATSYFEWMNRQVGEAQWRQYGNDVTGVFNR